MIRKRPPSGRDHGHVAIRFWPYNGFVPVVAARRAMENDLQKAAALHFVGLVLLVEWPYTSTALGHLVPALVCIGI
jgi:hypothetical protein